MRISRGHAVAAMKYAKDMTELAEKYEGVSSCSAYMDSFGDIGTVRFFMDFNDLATFEKVQTQALADDAYWKKLEEGKDLFIEGSTRNVIMREI
jgi:hypothetical protein